MSPRLTIEGDVEERKVELDLSLRATRQAANALRGHIVNNLTDRKTNTIVPAEESVATELQKLVKALAEVK